MGNYSFNNINYRRHLQRRSTVLNYDILPEDSEEMDYMVWFW
jgi:hypothetical protein